MVKGWSQFSSLSRGTFVVAGNYSETWAQISHSPLAAARERGVTSFAFVAAGVTLLRVDVPGRSRG